jgi:CubicO group peptidase (beta-lactamase class C family)
MVAALSPSSRFWSHSELHGSPEAGEPANTSLRFGGPTAPELMQAMVNLPVVADQVDQEFSYNNTVNAVGAYLPLLASGVAPGDLPAAYGKAMQDRVFGPAGMSTARIAPDPRGLVDDYATGSGFDLRPRATTIPFGPVGSHAPAGGALCMCARDRS